MDLDRAVTSPVAKSAALLLLRITTGFLLVWFGLNKIVSGSAPLMVRRNVELDDATGTAISLVTGGGEVLIGALCVIGLWRKVALPLQALINGATAASVWWAILDPFRWYISGVDRIVFNSHVFYSTSITFAGCILLIAFRQEDNIAMDRIWKTGS